MKNHDFWEAPRGNPASPVPRAIDTEHREPEKPRQNRPPRCAPARPRSSTAASRKSPGRRRTSRTASTASRASARRPVPLPPPPPRHTHLPRPIRPSLPEHGLRLSLLTKMPVELCVHAQPAGDIGGLLPRVNITRPHWIAVSLSVCSAYEKVKANCFLNGTEFFYFAQGVPPERDILRHPY